MGEWTLRIWALISDRAGDNAQVLAVAEALQLPFESRRFATRPGAIAANLIGGPSLARGRFTAEAPLAAPWPHLVIAAGTQSEPILADLAARAARDGARPRLVFLGRPWARLDRYDLIVTTPQYRVPPAGNVLEIDLPLHRVTPERIAAEAAVWAPRVADLPRPYIAVMLGGPISRYAFDAHTAERIAREAGALAEARGGALLVCGGHRTPDAVPARISAALRVPASVFDWRRAQREGNPYLGFLGLADEIVVTGDSMSMLAEACATGKPVHIFDLGEGRYGMRLPPAPNAAAPRLKTVLLDLKVRLVQAILPRRLHRDTRHVHKRLVDGGRAVWLGDLRRAQMRTAASELAAVVERVRRLLA
jgi:mitochondrial fission protein ELM1